MRFMCLFLMITVFLQFAMGSQAQLEVGLVYFLPSDRTAQLDIDSNIDTLIKGVQTVYSNNVGKTFTFETDADGNAKVHHITGGFTDAYYDDANKWNVWDEIKAEGFDPSEKIYVAFVDLSSQDIDGWCGTGGDWTNTDGGVTTLTASGTCFEGDYGKHIAVHELGHAFGLRHDMQGTIDYATGQDPMVSSACATEWLDGHPYFNGGPGSSGASTTIELASPTVSGSDATFSFTITDADGLHQAQFFISNMSPGYPDLNILDCKSLSGTSATAEFTTSVLTSETDSVTLRVMDGTGRSTEVQFLVDLSWLNPATDVNAGGTVNTGNLVKLAANFGQQGKNPADLNGDGIVNILDLVLAASALSNDAAAPSIGHLDLKIAPTRAEVQEWLREARQLNLTDPAFQRGILVLEQLLVALMPQETILLPNYPNPFNPETWIPYQLSEAAEVAITIYNVTGNVVRSLDLGHRGPGFYHSRSEAAYWDGRNSVNERVASGVYFYHIQAGEFSATRRMLILK